MQPLPRPDAVAQPPDDVADRIQQPGLFFFGPVHAVFPYGRARPPCTIPCVVKKVCEPRRRPRRDITRRRRGPPQTP